MTDERPWWEDALEQDSDESGRITGLPGDAGALANPSTPPASPPPGAIPSAPPPSGLPLGDPTAPIPPTAGPGPIPGFASPPGPGPVPPPAAPPDVPTSAGRPKRRWAAGLAVVAAVLLTAGVGVWAVQTFLLRGGSGSPEAAATTLIDALRSQDPIAAAAVMNPDEVRELPAFVGDAVGKAKELQISTGSTVPGLIVEIDDYQLDVDEEAEGVARVTVRNPAYRVAYRGESLTGSGSALAGVDDLATADASTDQSALGDTELMVMVVDSGSGWYVSPAMTALEYLFDSDAEAVGISGAPDYDAFRDEATPTNGSPEPEDVPEDVARAVEEADTRELVDLLPSDQSRVVGPYADFLAAWLSSAGFTGGGFALDDVEVTSEDGGGGRRLVASSVEYTDGSGTVDTDYGDPGEATGPDDCVSLLEGRYVGGFLGYSCVAENTPLARKLGEAGLDRPSVIVRPVDDGWKLDPLATIVDWGRRALEVVDADTLRAGLGSTTGDVDQTLAPGTVADVAFGERGYSVLELSTEAGRDYVLGFGVDEAESDDGFYDVDLRVTAADGSVLEVESPGSRQVVFRADGPTRVFIGGLENRYPDAKVALLAAEPGTAAVQGGLVTTLEGELNATGAELWTVQVPAGVNSLEANSAGDSDYPSVYRRGENSLLGEPVGSTDELPAGTEVVVVVTGRPGSAFAAELTGVTRGFSDGSRTRTITVPSGDDIVERIELGSSSLTTTIDLQVQGSSWSASVESEDSSDSSSSYSGSMTGTLSITDSGTADLSLSCGSTSIRTSCIFTVTIS